MNRLATILNSPAKRILTAALVAGSIAAAVQTFAASTSTATQKLQIESARGQHCAKWASAGRGEQRQPVCERWDYSGVDKQPKL